MTETENNNNNDATLTQSTAQRIRDETLTLKDWMLVILSEYSTLISVLVFGGVILTAVAVGTDTVPSVPDWAWAYIVLGLVAGVVTYPLQGWVISQMLDDGVILHDVHPTTGDFAVYELDEDRFDELTVEAPVGVEDGEVQYEETDTGDLYTVSCSYGPAYECVEYDDETNTAYISWMGGASPSEIRASRKVIERVQTRLSLLADAGLEEIVNRPEIIRSVAAQVTLYLVESHQKAVLPEGDEIAGLVTDALQDHLSVDVTEIESDLDRRMPDEYSEMYQGGELQLDAAQKAEVMDGDAQ